MGPPRRKLLATAEETMSPPDDLSDTQTIARVVKAIGNNLYNVTLPTEKELLVEMPAKFRSTIWLKRGGYVLIDTAQQERDNKIQGEIINVVRDEKAWRKQQYWPKDFVKRTTVVAEDDEDERSNVGMMPPSDDEED